jgi:hypothetical protein
MSEHRARSQIALRLSAGVLALALGIVALVVAIVLLKGALG